jgi:hypothetical protein
MSKANAPQVAKLLREYAQRTALRGGNPHYRANEANERAVDFILAFGAPLFKLAKISDGVVRQNRSVEWIGDHAGFSAFQEFRAKRVDPTIPFIAPKLHSLRKSEMQSPCFDMIGTMRNVIGQANVQGVFGHPVAASNLENAPAGL